MAALGVGEQLDAPTKPLRLILQSDGNLVLYRNDTARWSLVAPGPAVGAVMQADGNLVVLGVAGPLWSTKTYGHPGSRLVLQDDGNLVVYDTSDNPLWWSGSFVTWPEDGPRNTLYGTDRLRPDESLFSTSMAFRLTAQSDGNLVLYAGLTPIWWSNTFGAVSQAVMQLDGNFVLYGLDWTWHTNTFGHAGARLVLRDDGNFAVYDVDDRELWSSEVFVDGELFREVSKPEVYVIYDRTRFWIPTPDALTAMGHSWSDVRVVPDGSRSFLPKVWIDSASPTPGSLVYPPQNDSRRENGKHFAIKGVETSIRVRSQGKEVRVIELCGWLYPDSPVTNRETDRTWNDWHYYLEVDSVWAVERGIDLNQILKVGNILKSEGYGLDKGSPDSYRSVSLPRIGLEINGWFFGNSRGVDRPTDWTFPADGTPAGQDFANTEIGQEFADTWWPYDPRKRVGDLAEEAAAPYARVVGSLIADVDHNGGAATSWRAGRSKSDENNPSRHAEIHPPDRIEMVEPNLPRRETLRGIALVAGNGIFDAAEQELSAHIAPPGPRPSFLHRAAVVEEVGPETNFGTIKVGNESKTGARLTVLDDAVNVYVKVARTGIFGVPGKFKAIYRVFWVRDSSLAVPPACQGLKNDVDDLQRSIADLKDLLREVDPAYRQTLQEELTGKYDALAAATNSLAACVANAAMQTD